MDHKTNELFCVFTPFRFDAGISLFLFFVYVVVVTVALFFSRRAAIWKFLYFASYQITSDPIYGILKPKQKCNNNSYSSGQYETSESMECKRHFKRDKRQDFVFIWIDEYEWNWSLCLYFENNNQAERGSP